MQRARTLGLVLAGALAAAASAAWAAGDGDIVRIDGSSTVYPITEAVAEEFQIKYRGKYRVTVGISGTGGGFRKFCRGDIDINDASRPIRGPEREACAAAGIRYLELPVAMDALTVVVNPQNDWVDCLTVEDLRRIWEPAAQGRITRWNQVRPDWPDRPLNLYAPGVDSGTYDYFTEAVMGEAGASRGDYTASEDDNVLVQGVASDPNALGFFGLAYYVENRDRLKAVKIRNPRTGACVEPSVETARAGDYAPLARPLFIYVNPERLDTKPAVAAFVDTYLDAELVVGLVQEVGYVPLPEEGYALAQAKVKARRTGTAFHEEGAGIGLSIEELLRAETVD